MSFSAFFHLGSSGNSILDLSSGIRLNYCYVDINQDVDGRGRPSSIPKGGKITIEFDTLDNDSVTIWAADPVKEKDGKIVYRGIDNSSIQKEITFEKGICVEFSERFDSTSSASMVTVITISAPKIKIDGSTLDNHWDTQFKGDKAKK
jgi:Hemolysin coregulated protein Hcp (TssD)